MKNYEFELNATTYAMALHMMDRADKYLNRICEPHHFETQHVLIHGPDHLPHEILGLIENVLHHRQTESFKPKKELKGVISVKLHNPYTIVFEIAKLWFDQKTDEIQDKIIELMGLESDYLEMDWAQKQWDDLKSFEKDHD